MSVYLDRYAYPDQLIDTPPASNTDLIVVIPCYNEEGIIDALESLQSCELPPCSVEVIIIINESESTSSQSRNQNLLSFEEIKSWVPQPQTEQLKFYVRHLIFADKVSGVGMARKAGMDEAVRRFEFLKNPHGVICGFDADSKCDSNYFTAVYKAFYEQSTTPTGASIYFEHPLDNDSAVINQGISLYELHLRYYVNGLHYAGFPYAFQTVGSSMAVRSDIYQKQGGMNKRKAGEDFYFIHKIAPLGNYIDINDTRVIPSARVSDRVPFGTGRAMAEWHSHPEEEYKTYNFQSFADLRLLFEIVPTLFRASEDSVKLMHSNLPESLKSYMRLVEFDKQINEINRQSTTQAIFHHRFFYWFNGFKVLKFIHYARDNFHGNVPLINEAKLLANEYFNDSILSNQVSEILTYFRQQDRKSDQRKHI